MGPQIQVTRRRLVRYAGVALGWLGFKHLVGLAVGAQEMDTYAINPCTKVIQDAKDSLEAIALPRDELLFWVDIPMARSKSNLAILWKKIQTKRGYLSKVVFSNADKKTIGIHYFPKPEKPSNEYPPLVFFDNLPIDSSQTYYLLCEWIENNTTLKIYRYVFHPKDLEASTIASEEMPPSVQASFAKTHKGEVSSIFRPSFDLKVFVSPQSGEHVGGREDQEDMSSAALSAWLKSERFQKLELSIFPTVSLVLSTLNDSRDFDLNVDFASGLATSLQHILVTDALGRLIYTLVVMNNPTSQRKSYSISVKNSRVPLRWTPYLMIFCSFDKFLIKTKVCMR